MRVRLKDVARAAGVSDATVSLALSGNPRISEATRKRVKTVARELGYRPNVAARALRTEATRNLGLIVSDVANPFFAELAGEIERMAAREGYSLMLCNSDEDAERQDVYLSNMFAGSQVDGVMLVPTAAMTPEIRRAGHEARKMVLLDRPIAVRGKGTISNYLRALPVVRSEPSAALAQAAELLHGHGHRRVGIVAPPLHTQLGRERRDAIHQALVAVGVPRAGISVVPGDFRQDSGERAIAALLAQPERPTAVVAADAPMAIGVLKGLRSAGLRVPRDMSVIGFDDAPWFDMFDPPLTTLAQPISALASAAVRAILALVRDEAMPSADELRPACALVLRESCATPPATAEHGGE